MLFRSQSTNISSKTITLTPTSITTNIASYGTNTIYVFDSTSGDSCSGIGAYDGAYVFNGVQWINAGTGNYIFIDTGSFYFYDNICANDIIANAGADPTGVWTYYYSDGQWLGTVTYGTNVYSTNGVVSWNFAAAPKQVVDTTAQTLNQLLVVPSGASPSIPASTLYVKANGALNIVFTNSFINNLNLSRTNAVITNAFIAAQCFSTNINETEIAIKSAK